MDARDRALLQVGIAAALADGMCDERERSHLDAMARAAGAESSAALGAGRTLPADIATRLGTPEAKQAAYDLAVAVCNADGSANEAETRFLTSLRGTLGLSEARAADAARAGAALGGSAVTGAPAAGTAASTDDLILQQAVLAGALELLPQALASLAVIPVQLRLVYQIGRQHGQQLDAAQAKDLLATFGIGAATQVVDGAARQLLSGVARGCAGHAAKQYYRQGRKLDTADLQALFAKLRDQAQTLYPKVQAQIQERARTLDLQQLTASLTRG